MDSSSTIPSKAWPQAAPDSPGPVLLERLVPRLLDGIGGLPRQTLWRLADSLGQLWYRIDRRHRQIALGNLTRAYGNELTAADRVRIAKGTFQHLARVMLEFSWLQQMTDARLDSLVDFSGMEHLYRAVDAGRGVLILTSHFGNWELMALACPMRYKPMDIVVRPLDHPQLDRMINAIRTRTGNRLIPKKGSVRQVLRSLHRGLIVGILADQNVDWYDGVFVPFFKDIACTNKALAVLALRTGAQVIPAHNVRQPDGRYRIVVQPEVPLIRTGDMTSDIEENTAQFNQVIERYVRQNPEQWFWLHQRWKTRPWKPWPRVQKKHAR